MKKLLLLTILLSGGMMYQSAIAQKKVNVQINVNSQPDWGPAGYNYAEYYYLPDADMYYNIASHDYIYQERGRWVNVRVLPPHLRNVDLYRSYKVVVNDRNPWLRNNYYKRQYVVNRGRPTQVNWRDSRKTSKKVVVINDRRPNAPVIIHRHNQDYPPRNSNRRY